MQLNHFLIRDEIRVLVKHCVGIWIWQYPAVDLLIGPPEMLGSVLSDPLDNLALYLVSLEP